VIEEICRGGRFFNDYVLFHDKNPRLFAFVEKRDDIITHTMRFHGCDISRAKEVIFERFLKENFPGNKIRNVYT
jgi:hypothetical protein